jgi:hypothetical protein
VSLRLIADHTHDLDDLKRFTEKRAARPASLRAEPKAPAKLEIPEPPKLPPMPPKPAPEDSSGCEDSRSVPFGQASREPISDRPYGTEDQQFTLCETLILHASPRRVSVL